MGDVLVLQTMYFGNEVRDPGELDLPSKVELSDRELKIADQLIHSLTVDFDPSSYADTYRERVLDLVEQKAEGKDIVVEERDEPEPLDDLMAALEASVSSIKDARSARKSPGSGKGTTSLDGLSKDELYDRATKADIDGRSKMSKDQLIEALRRAS